MPEFSTELAQAESEYPLGSFVSVYYLRNKPESFGMVIGHRKVRQKMSTRQTYKEYDTYEREDVQVQILTSLGPEYYAASSSIWIRLLEKMFLKMC